MIPTIEKTQSVDICCISEYLTAERHTLIHHAARHKNSCTDAHFAPQITSIQVAPSGLDIVLFGGMGAAATLQYLSLFCECDLSGIRTIYCLQATDIPDRTAALIDTLRGDNSRETELVTKIHCYLSFLSQILPHDEPATLIFLCNTLHAFLPKISIDNRRYTPISLLDFVEKIPPRQKILGLYTRGTKQSRLYHIIPETQLVELTDEDTDFLMELIYRGVKSFDDEYIHSQKVSFIALLSRYQYDAVLFGCTEVSSLFQLLDLVVPVIDPVMIAYQKIVTISNKNVASFASSVPHAPKLVF
jgi:aspartate/glutamate racemase